MHDPRLREVGRSQVPYVRCGRAMGLGTGRLIVHSTRDKEAGESGVGEGVRGDY